MKHLKLYETQVSPFIYIITEWSKSNNKLYLLRVVKTTKFEINNKTKKRLLKELYKYYYQNQK